MEMGSFAMGSMIPTLIEWAYASKMKNHLPKEVSNLFEFTGTHNLHVHLTYLDKKYNEKFVEPNFQRYCLSFVEQITPILKQWAVKNNLSGLNIILRFQAHYIYAAKIKFTL